MTGTCLNCPPVLENAYHRVHLVREKDALRKSEENYRLLTETARDFIVGHDLDGRITFVNPAAIAIQRLNRDGDA